MKLSIVIPHYKEPFELCKPLLDSIAIQMHFDLVKDLDVIMVNDGNEVEFDESVFANYPFKVRYLKKKHEGVSAARNFGLVRTKGDYVMFCDFDDRFISSFAFHLINDATKENPDIIFGCFMEELLVNGEYKLTRRDKDSTFVHGKVFRREYLKSNNIKFDPYLTIHEDSFFVCLASSLTENKVEIKVPFYMWCWNENSTVRQDTNLYIMRTYKNVMDSRIALCRELFKRGEIDKYCNIVCKTVLDAYYDSNKPDWLNPENEELVKSAEEEFRRFYDEFGKDYNECNVGRIAEMMYVCRDLAYRNGLRVEQRTVNQWLTHICNDLE